MLGAEVAQQSELRLSAALDLFMSLVQALPPHLAPLFPQSWPDVNEKRTTNFHPINPPSLPTYLRNCVASLSILAKALPKSRESPPEVAMQLKLVLRA